MADERAQQRGRRAGYVIAAVFNLILWFLANISPGWQAVPFLSDSAVEVLPCSTSRCSRSPRRTSRMRSSTRPA